MKKLYFLILIIGMGLQSKGQQASMIIPTQALNPQGINPPNLLYVRPSDLRVWPVVMDSIKWKPINLRWITDSLRTRGDLYVKLSGSYSNPSWITSLAGSKVTGLGLVAYSNNYNDLINKPNVVGQIQSDYGQSNSSATDYIKNKPNLNLYETISGASSKYYPITNPNGYISSFTELDPIWNADKPNYYTKSQDDARFKPIGYTPTGSEIVSGLGYTPYNGATNPNGYLSVVPAQSFASLTGKPTTLIGYGITDAVPSSRNITINGVQQDLSSDRSWTVGDVTSSGLATTLASYATNASLTANYPSNSSLASTLSGYALTSAVNASLTTKFNNPTGNSSQYLNGAGVPTTFPTIPAAQVNSDWNAVSGLAQILNKPTIPAQYNPTAGTGIAITGTFPNQTITNTNLYVVPTPVTATRTLNSNFTISTTKQAIVNYTISLSVTNPLVTGTSVAAAYLEYSINSGTSWIPVSDALVSSGVAVAVAIAITNTQSQILSGVIPANALVRIRTTTSGTASTVFVRGQETY